MQEKDLLLNKINIHRVEYTESTLEFSVIIIQ